MSSEAPGDGYFVVRISDGNRIQVQVSDGAVVAIGSADGLDIKDLAEGVIAWDDFVTLHGGLDVEEKKG